MAKGKAHPSKQKTSVSRRSDFVVDIENNKYFPLIYAGATLLFVIILFHEFIFSGQMLYGSDTIQAGVYFRELLVSHFRETGSVPLWNPYIFCGLPYVDAFHGDVFYLPTFILKMIMPLHKALGWGLVLHIYLSGIFTYLCARGFGLSRLASAFAGISYMFSGYLVSLVAPGHDGKIFVTTLFPLAFHLLNQGMTTFKLKFFLLLGIVIAFIILTPHPQMAYFSLWALGGYFLLRVLFKFKEKVGITKISLVSLMFVLAVFIGLLGSAIQFYPGYKYISEFSPRAGEGSEGRSGYEWATSWSLHFEELVGQVVPGFAGVENAASNTHYWGRNPFKDNTEYAGFFVILFGAIAIALRRNRETWFLLGLGIFAVIYALGATTPLFYIFYYLIPQVKKMRAPSMIMFLFSFSFSLLAAYGIDALSKLKSSEGNKKREKLNKGLLIAGLILTVITLIFTVAGSSIMSAYTSLLYSEIAQQKQQVLTSHIPNIIASLWVITALFWLAFLLIRGFLKDKIGRTAIVMVIFLALIDLWRVDFQYVTTIDYDQYFPKAPVISQLENNEKEPFRIFDLTRQSFSSKDYFALNHVEQMTGYHGAQLKSYDEFIGGLNYRRLVGSKGINIRPFQLTNTKYLVLDRGRGMDESQGIKKVYDNEVAVFSIPNVMKRAAIYHAYQLGKSDTTDLELLYNESFPFRKILILQEEPQYAPVLIDTAANESVELVEQDLVYQKYQVELSQPGLLFVSDNYFPGWKVKVDDIECKLLKADYTFRAVSLDKGSHQVEFYFDWQRYKTSRMVTIVTFALSFLCLAGCLVIERRKEN